METKLIRSFFHIIFDEHEGFLCIAARRTNGPFAEEFFKYPEELDKAVEYVTRNTTSNVYYCPHLFESARRTKQSVAVTPVIWADLDACRPDMCLKPPSIPTETSPNRFQGIWLLESPIPPHEAEDISKRIAYYHSDDGADKSGWDLTQLLRVPGTFNLKYSGQSAEVKVLKTHPGKYTQDDFSAYPKLASSRVIRLNQPDHLPEQTADELLQKHRHDIPPKAHLLYNTHPEKDWSKQLWELNMLLLETGLPREEVFVIAKAAKCNKYERDNRSEEMLWREVCRASVVIEDRRIALLPTGDSTLPPLLSQDERGWVENQTSFIEEYIEWGKSVGDAAWQYHQAGAFTVLSGLLAGAVRLPTSYGTLVPNLWFMILADTTLTRKTTAMDLSMDLLFDVDPDVVLATDGSIEGVFEQISYRPGRPSVFLRDEVTGLVEGMAKKDYMAGMMEMFCKLYDGKFQKRVLRKQVVEIHDPCLIFFAGGIKSRMQSLLTTEHVSSGFIPRFCIISAEGNVQQVRPLGPPIQQTTAARDKLVKTCQEIKEHYKTEQSFQANGKVVHTKRTWNAELDSEAWQLYNRIEHDMLRAASEHSKKDLLVPSFQRLCLNGLKAATLLAASRQREEKIVVEQIDVLRAFYYIEQWMPHSIEAVSNVDLSGPERKVTQILKAVKKRPEGVMRSTLMQNHHIGAKEMDAILQTLEQRDQINRFKRGTGERIEPREMV